jgi:glycerol-3-phosphate acyltransferase PlsY
VYAYGMGNKPVALAAAILALLSIIRHHANIKRMLNGEEPKIRG